MALDDDHTQDAPSDPEETSDFVQPRDGDETETQGLPSADRVDSAHGDLPEVGKDRRWKSGSNLPEQIDRYRIIRELGEGGFGVVYLAEQSEPVRRQVALKVIRFGFGSSPNQARFEAERQALAVLNHPGIAKIFDAGRTDRGQSWFAMEYVEGKPLDRMLDDESVDFEERIRMMIRVCEAVQHAHGKGVVHRDLKPGNIIVTRDGDTLTPRVIDFGIAKALDPDLESGVVTEEGQFLGTPGYMSPEQTGHGRLDIDARTDVYSLGAILYQVLCGLMPLPREELLEARKAGGFAGIARLIAEFEPTRPSVRFEQQVATDDKVAGRIARQRGLDPSRLVRRLRGDLDWISLACLEVDRERRYNSPAAIADDLRRHLDDLPISVGRPSTLYQLHKFVRRNRALAFGLSAVLVTLVIGLVTSLALLYRAVDAERTAYQMLGALTEGIRAADPSLAGEEATVGDLYRRLANQIERGTLGNRPQDAARLLLAFSITSYNLNDYHSAAEYAQRVIALSESGNNIPTELIEEAGKRLSEARLALGETTTSSMVIEAPQTVPELMQMQYIAWNLGDYDLAAYYLDQVTAQLAGPLATDGVDWDPFATASEYQARLLSDRGAFNAADDKLDLADRIRREFGEIDEDGLTQWDAGTQLARGALLRSRGEFAAAERELAIAARMYDELHGGNDRFMVNLAEAERRTAELDAARLDGEEVDLLEAHPELGVMEMVLLRNRARAWARLGRMAEAEALFAMAIELEQGLEEEFRHPGHTRSVWARLLAASGDLPGAKRQLELAVLETGESPEISNRPDLLLDQALLLIADGDLSAARGKVNRVVEIRRNTLPPDAWPRVAVEALALHLEAPDDPERIELLREAVQTMKRMGVVAHPLANRMEWAVFGDQSLNMN